MARYSLNLPIDLKTRAEQWAMAQEVSLNQFILWAVSEKVSSLDSSLIDPKQYPHIGCYRGASGHIWTVIRGTRVRVQTIVIMHENDGLSAQEIAEEYGFVSKVQVENALKYYRNHKEQIKADIAFDEKFALTYVPSPTAS